MVLRGVRVVVVARAGMQRYVYRAREALAECTTDETPSELEFSFLSDT